MATSFTCSQGHHWEAAADSQSPATAAPSQCPVCGGAPATAASSLGAPAASPAVRSKNKRRSSLLLILLILGLTIVGGWAAYARWVSGAFQSYLLLGAHHNAVRALAFSADGKQLAVGDDDGILKRWDVDSRRERFTLVGSGASILAVAFTPDGRTLASGGKDAVVKLWDTATGQEQAMLKDHKTHIFSLAISQDGRLLASGGIDGMAKVWDLSTKKVVAALDHRPSPVYTVRFSPDGKSLASLQGLTIRLWDTNDWTEQGTYPDGGYGEIRSLAFASGGQRLAGGYGYCVIKLRDTASGEIERTLEGHTGAIWALASSPDGNTLASASYDGTVRLWDPAAGELRFTLVKQAGGVNAISFSPDGKRIATASGDFFNPGSVRIWDLP